MVLGHAPQWKELGLRSFSIQLSDIDIPGIQCWHRGIPSHPRSMPYWGFRATALWRRRWRTTTHRTVHSRSGFIFSSALIITTIVKTNAWLGGSHQSQKPCPRLVVITKSSKRSPGRVTSSTYIRYTSAIPHVQAPIDILPRVWLRR